MQKNISTDAYTSDGYVLHAGSSSRVDNGQNWTEATHILWKHPENGSMWKTKQIIMLDISSYFETGIVEPRVIKVEDRCIKPAK